MADIGPVVVRRVEAGGDGPGTAYRTMRLRAKGFYSSDALTADSIDAWMHTHPDVVIVSCQLAAAQGRGDGWCEAIVWYREPDAPGGER